MPSGDTRQLVPVIGLMQLNMCYSAAGMHMHAKCERRRLGQEEEEEVFLCNAPGKMRRQENL